jgi:hypothetical protein
MNPIFALSDVTVISAFYPLAKLRKTPFWISKDFSWGAKEEPHHFSLLEPSPYDYTLKRQPHEKVCEIMNCVVSFDRQQFLTFYNTQFKGDDFSKRVLSM